MKVISSLKACSCHYHTSLADLLYVLFIKPASLMKCSFRPLLGKARCRCTRPQTRTSNMSVISQNARSKVIISSHGLIILAACAAFSCFSRCGITVMSAGHHESLSKHLFVLLCEAARQQTWWKRRKQGKGSMQQTILFPNFDYKGRLKTWGSCLPLVITHCSQLKAPPQGCDRSEQQPEPLETATRSLPFCFHFSAAGGKWRIFAHARFLSGIFSVCLPGLPSGTSLVVHSHLHWIVLLQLPHQNTCNPPAAGHIRPELGSFLLLFPFTLRLENDYSKYCQNGHFSVFENRHKVVAN